MSLVQYVGGKHVAATTGFIDNRRERGQVCLATDPSCNPDAHAHAPQEPRGQARDRRDCQPEKFATHRPAKITQRRLLFRAPWRRLCAAAGSVNHPDGWPLRQIDKSPDLRRLARVLEQSPCPPASPGGRCLRCIAGASGGTRPTGCVPRTQQTDPRRGLAGRWNIWYRLTRRLAGSTLHQANNRRLAHEDLITGTVAALTLFAGMNLCRRHADANATARRLGGRQGPEVDG